MKSLLLIPLALTGGAFLAMQAGFNSQLTSFLKNPVLTSVITSSFSVLYAGLIVVLSGRELPGPDQIRAVPVYLWAIGGLFSVLGISIYFYAIPRLGISKMIALGLCGQLILSLAAGHFGWLGLPKEPITWHRMIGVCAMIVGIIMINKN